MNQLFYRPAQAAQQIGVSRSYLYQLIADGKLAAMDFADGITLIDAKVLEAFVRNESQRREEKKKARLKWRRA